MQESLLNRLLPKTGPNLVETWVCALYVVVRNLKNSPRRSQIHGRSAHVAWHCGQGLASSSEVPFGASTLPRKFVAEKKQCAGGSNLRSRESVDRFLERQCRARGERLPAPPLLLPEKVGPTAMQFASFCSPKLNCLRSTNSLAHNWPQLCAAVREPLNLD